MNIDWDSLENFTDWSGALHRLLDEAKAAVQAGNIDRKVAVQGQLTTFIFKSPNRLGSQLDKIAEQVVEDVFLVTVDEALQRNASRTMELTQLTKTIAGVAEELNRSSRSIRLQNATSVIGSATEIVKSLTDLRQSLKDGEIDDEALAKKIDKTVKAVNDLIPAVMAVRG